MKKLLIIGGSPRPNGVSEELIRQVKPYFIDCKIVEYNTYKLAPAPCTDCRFCEQHAGCANKDLDIFFEDFEDADYIAFFTPVYNNFFPAPLKAVIDRFQRYYSARFKRGAKPPIAKPKRVGVVIVSGSNARQCADERCPSGATTSRIWAPPSGSCGARGNSWAKGPTGSLRSWLPYSTPGDRGCWFTRFGRPQRHSRPSQTSSLSALPRHRLYT